MFGPSNVWTEVILNKLSEKFPSWAWIRATKPDPLYETQWSSCQTSLLSVRLGKRLAHLSIKSYSYRHWLTSKRQSRKMVSNGVLSPPGPQKKARHSQVLSKAASSPVQSLPLLTMSVGGKVKIHLKSWFRFLPHYASNVRHLTVPAGHLKAMLRQKSEVIWRFCHHSNKVPIPNTSKKHILVHLPREGTSSLHGPVKGLANKWSRFFIATVTGSYHCHLIGGVREMKSSVICRMGCPGQHQSFPTQQTRLQILQEQ